MTIKTRLRLSYIAMTLISTILIILLNHLFFDYEDSNFVSTNPYAVLRDISVVRESISRRINIADLEIANDPNCEESLKFLKSFERDLSKINSGIIIRNGDKIIYCSDLIKGALGKVHLPGFKEPFEEDAFFSYSGNYMLVSQYDFFMNDGSKASMFVILDNSTVNSNLSETRTRLSIIIAFVILATSGMITYFMYRSIANPLKRLKAASNEIKNGNLDFNIEAFSSDEIGELGVAFEEMRKKLNDSLEMQAKYEENRQNLISNISHDLKTPIMSIKGHIEGIRDGIANSPEKLEKYTEIIYKKASEMELMIDEVFTFSKLDLGKVSFNFNEVEMCNYIQFCVEDLGIVVEKSNGILEFSKSCERAVAIIDPEKLKRVFTNIISNALKYMDKETPIIQISLEDCGDLIKIGIHDNGKGIPDKSLPFIFDRFYRADESRNTKIPGSGLGLAISKQIISMHGGNIWAKSEHGEGTSIYFTLKKKTEANRNEEDTYNRG